MIATSDEDQSLPTSAAKRHISQIEARAVVSSVAPINANTSDAHAANSAKLQWIGFDLDDTLHDFTTAFLQATKSVFTMLVACDERLRIDVLENSYRAICKTVVTAFTDGRTSADYRSERMSALLKAHGITGVSVDECVHAYAQALTESLRVMDGAHAVLDFIRSQAIRTAVISEGVHDAQEWTLQQLDLTKYVDILVTSNRERISKQAGLFQRFAAMVNVAPEEILIIGDCLENDILPAKALGMHALHFSPSSPQPMTAGVESIADLSEVPAYLQKNFLLTLSS